ncbi:hypothetical protein ABB07_00285 [Streptomyces incarnatus]|uniref:Vegetative cell wall protein gp1 n=1 Tax=Streptomyces incarnatus TaxID=665007 RepID=A0ABM5TCC5_9ACTN|nr:hypothetical protein [Streptomyces incarnatus]AKJ08544.1 hypothetical protein ABB07_00285 [Streptomyces incarnatus]
MNGLLAEIGKKLADRWLSALLLPGLLFTSVVLCGWWLGHAHALDPARLQAYAQRLGQQLNGRPAAVLLAVMGALLCATATGLAVQALAAVVRRSWAAASPTWWVALRRRRVEEALLRRGHTVPERYLPARVTTIGDRFRLVGERIDAQYGLFVTLAWPRLWLLLPEPVTTTVRDATTRYRVAAETAAWGTLYLLLGIVWWPAALVGVVTLVTGYVRGRSSAAVLADLVEAAVDTHQRMLADSLGVELPNGRITPAEGARINDMLNKRA